MMKKFKSTSMADFAPKLPQDLIDEVLLRLPVRSIGRFRCVSKLWRSLLSSPKFAKSHLNFHLHRDVPNVVLAADIDELTFRRNAQLLHLLTFPVDGCDGRSRVVTCPFFGRWGYMMVLAACHGFVLFLLGKVGKFVFNPVTLQSFKLPDFELDLEFADGMYGMGYDSCSDDYKIVKLSYYEADSGGGDDDSGSGSGSDSDSSEECDGTFVDVYSLKMKCWRRVAKSPYDHDMPDTEHAGEYPGLFMNGFLHWVALDSAGDNYVISAFNLAREEFEEVPLPKYFDGNCEILQVAVLRGCFAIVSCLSDECTDVWLMKEYGVQESWEKLVINTRGSLRISAVLFLSRDDEFILVQLLDSFLMKLIAYSLITGAWRDIVVDDIPDEFDQRVMTFTECLLSPNHISD